MKLTKLDIKNFIGARSVTLNGDAPLRLLAGQNDSGKSSTYEAINVAMTGEMARVKLKKDYGQLVSDGAAKDGAVVADFSIGRCSFTVPKGVRGVDAAITELGWAIPSCLHAHTFAALDPKERRAFLFKLTGLSMSPADIGARLGDRDIPVPIIDAIMPTLKTKGFEAASVEAARRATEAKGSWRAVTGKTWGAIAGAEFKADVPEFDADEFARASTDLVEARRELEKAVAAAAHASAVASGAEDWRKRLAAAQDALAGRDELLAKEKEADAKVLAAQAVANAAGEKARAADLAYSEFVKAHPTKPMPELLARCREVLGELAAEDWGDGVIALVKDIDDAYPPPVAIPDALTTARGDTSDAFDAANKALTEARAEYAAGGFSVARASFVTAEAEIKKATAALAEVPEPVDETYIQRLRDSVAGLEDQVNSSRETAAAYKQAVQARENATTYHHQIIQWDACAKALSPNGIQADILSGALDPVNDALRRIAESSTWPQVRIDADMEISVDGRPYGLWSESGQWRADAAIACMIAMLSGVRWLMLDRVDVLGVNNRPLLIEWLTQMREEGAIDGALALGTFASKPTGLPESWDVTWLEAGRSA